MEAATGHPLQAFADLITIEQYKTDRPKVVSYLAPHPKAFARSSKFICDFMNEANVDFVITHPKGYGISSSVRRKLKGI